jgi:hypothetical protein
LLLCFAIRVRGDSQQANPASAAATLRKLIDLSPGFEPPRDLPQKLEASHK